MALLALLRPALRAGTACFFLAGQAVHAADLLEVYRQAQGNDPVFEAARYTLEAVAQRVPQARAGLLPQIALSGADNRTRARNTFNNNAPLERNIDTWNWNLQLTQPLLRVQNLYAMSEAESLLEQAEADYAKAEQDLILRVAQAYFDVVVAEEGIVVTEAQVKAMSEQLAIARRGYESGTASITDRHEAKSRVDLARAQRIAAANELTAKRGELEKIVGELPETLAVLQPALIAPKPQPEDDRSWIEQARENNPAVRAGRAALAAAEATVKKLRAEHLPTLDFTASTGRNHASGTYTMPSDYSTRANTTTTGVQLNIPIFAGGLTGAKVAEAIANRRKAQAGLEAAKRQAATDARQAYAGIANGQAQIEALESAVESGSSAVKGNQVGYRLGLRITIDVLNAEQQLFSSQRDLVKARYETLLQGLKLKAAAGILNEAEVETINKWMGERVAQVRRND